VAAALEPQKGYLEEKKNVSKQKGKHVKWPQVHHKEVCKFFWISASTYPKIMEKLPAGKTGLCLWKGEPYVLDLANKRQRVSLLQRRL
jgi:hypothetical protein